MRLGSPTSPPCISKLQPHAVPRKKLCRSDRGLCLSRVKPSTPQPWETAPQELCFFPCWCLELNYPDVGCNRRVILRADIGFCMLWAVLESFYRIHVLWAYQEYWPWLTCFCLYKLALGCCHVLWAYQQYWLQLFSPFYLYKLALDCCSRILGLSLPFYRCRAPCSRSNS